MKSTRHRPINQASHAFSHLGRDAISFTGINALVAISATGKIDQIPQEQPK